MNESEMNAPVPADVSQQVAALRQQVFSLLLALIVVSGTLTVTLYRQASLAGKDIAALKVQVIDRYKQQQPAMENFLNQLAAFGVTHPDFRTNILLKYGITSAPAPANAAAPGAPRK